MKKLLIVFIPFILIVSCQAVKQPNTIHYKTMKINNKEVKYQKVNDVMDKVFEKDLTSIYQNPLSNLTCKTYISKDYVSYKIKEETKDTTNLYTFNYHLDTSKKVNFNKTEFINWLNKYNKDYNFKEEDFFFLKPLIKENKIEIYISPYLTGNLTSYKEIPFRDELIGDDENETKYSKKIALTFDDGPSIKTKELVDLLEELNVVATFFVLGTNVKQHPDELIYISNHNHEIGNHSYSHPDFKKISVDAGIEEINKTQAEIFKVIKRYPRIFRFPYGSVNKEVIKKIKLPTVLWNADSLDWQCYDSQKIIEKLKKEMKEDSVVLFHDFKYYNKVAITKIVNDLKNDGYTFVTVSELFNYTSEEKIMAKIYRMQ